MVEIVGFGVIADVNIIANIVGKVEEFDVSRRSYNLWTLKMRDKAFFKRDWRILIYIESRATITPV